MYELDAKYTGTVEPSKLFALFNVHVMISVQFLSSFNIFRWLKEEEEEEEEEEEDEEEDEQFKKWLFSI